MRSAGLWLMGVAALMSVVAESDVERDHEKLVRKYLGEEEKTLRDAPELAKLIRDYGATLTEEGENERSETFNLTEYWNKYPEYAEKLFGEVVAAAEVERREDASSVTSFLQVGSQSPCEVCIYVIENKEQHQPFLCRGLKDPAQQQGCVSVLVSMFWWLENQVYWVNYGCQKDNEGQWEWVKPCPAHVICSFMQSLYDRKPFCPTSAEYRKPSAG